MWQLNTDRPHLWFSLNYYVYLFHSIIHIDHSSPTMSWLQSQDHKPLFPACCNSLVEQASSYSSCSLSVRPNIITQLFSVVMLLLTFLMTFSTLILKISFSESLFLCSPISSSGWSSGILPLVVVRTGGGSDVECSRLSQLSVMHYNIVMLTYLLTYSLICDILCQPPTGIAVHHADYVNGLLLATVVANRNSSQQQQQKFSIPL